MAGNMTTYLENKLLAHSLGQAAFTMPATVYVGLFTADPTAAGTQTSEVTGGSYARQAVTVNAPTNGSTANSAQIQFPQATAAWGTVAYIGIMDASTGGNMLWQGALATPQTVNNSDTFQFTAGSLTVSIS
jgi:hypothetical protein